MDNLRDIFGRINENGNVDVLNIEDGSFVTQIKIDNLYPVGSNLSSYYEHAEGIEITREDAGRIGLEIEE
jgi:hypothetical protein